MVTTKTFTQSCVHGAPPPCTHTCPLNMDIKKILKKIEAGNFTSAYREYRKRSIFPGIVSKICKMPCMKNCPSAISMILLERTCVEQTSCHNPESYNMPKKNKKIAVIGAGISGLACMYRLAVKSYDVTVFEKKDEIGGNLLKYMPQNEYLSELQGQLSKTDYSLLTKHEISDPQEIEAYGFDAIYISSGEGGTSFGLLDGYNSQTLETAKKGVFIGGSITGCDKVEALAQGLKAAASIEMWLKIGRIDIDEDESKNTCYYIPPDIKHDKKEVLIDLSGLPHDCRAAVTEAGRCLQCDCTLCYDTCEFMKEQKLMPKDLEVKTKNLRGPVTRVSNKTIASCTLCGHCASVCDFDVSTELVMRKGKQALFEDGGFPVVYHDYYMRDLEDALNDAYLCRPAPGYKSAKYLFFPGCQAANSNPAYITEPYRYMLCHDPDTAIMLGCCGIPALYAGDIKKMQEIHNRIIKEIHDLADPVVVLSCPSCIKMFDEFFPEIKYITVYEYILQNGIPSQAKSQEGVWAIFDPCSSRNFKELQDDVRELLSSAGLEFVELPENRKHALCCGQGGHIYAANPGLSKKIAEVALSQSGLPYVTYCTNCRDIFLSHGKCAIYALDVLFGIEPYTSQMHISQRQKNRYAARNCLLTEIWHEKQIYSTEVNDSIYALSIPENLKCKMDRLLLSEDDVRETILVCEEGRNYFVDQSTGTRIGCAKIGYLVIWAEYKIDKKDICVSNVYCHHMTFGV